MLYFVKLDLKRKWPFWIALTPPKEFRNQQLAKTFAESYIRTETKDRPKSEVVFSFGLGDSLSDSPTPNFGLSDAESKAS